MESEEDLYNLAFVAGNMAFWAGEQYTSNPYANADLAWEWAKGWLEAEEDCQRDAMRYSPEAQAMLEAQNGN